jgi:membrane protein implicated in regulation of membrane protease activity
MWKLWLIFSGIFFIIEMCTVGFLVFWFAIGALIAMIASFFIDSIVAQATIFLISSTILLFATRPFVNKFTKSENDTKTNAFAIEGKKGKVIKDINPVEGSGQIKIDGEVWSAKSFDGTCISQDTEVIVEKIDGVKAIVKPI